MIVLISTGTGYFNPRAPCGARHPSALTSRNCRYFNPRAPCGARRVGKEIYFRTPVFQPTRPLRGATQGPRQLPPPFSISTHAPLAGRDAAPLRTSTPLIYFNPRAPCGARLPCRLKLHAVKLFQPTRPLRGATMIVSVAPAGIRFQPTRPLRGATSDHSQRTSLIEFQPTRPLRGATTGCSSAASARTDFNPRAPCGARREVMPSALIKR